MIPPANRCRPSHRGGVEFCWRGDISIAGFGACRTLPAHPSAACCSLRSLLDEVDVSVPAAFGAADAGVVRELDGVPERPESSTQQRGAVREYDAEEKGTGSLR
jgi:hypothetical protein